MIKTIEHQPTPEQLQPLTSKQKAFINAYITCWNGALAWKLADLKCKPGIEDRAAHQMINRPHVKYAIDQHRAKIEQQSLVTFEKKVKLLWKIAEECMTPHEVIDHRTGNVTTKIEPEVTIKALAELNKMQGHYAPEKHINMNVEGSIERLERAKIEYKHA